MFYFKQLVGGANAFPYTLGQQFPSGGPVGWKHFEGTSKEDGSRVSIFRVSGSPSDHKLQAARNGVKRLKSVCPLFLLPCPYPYPYQTANIPSSSVPVAFIFIPVSILEIGNCGDMSGGSKRLLPTLSPV